MHSTMHMSIYVPFSKLSSSDDSSSKTIDACVTVGLDAVLTYVVANCEVLVDTIYQVLVNRD